MYSVQHVREHESGDGAAPVAESIRLVHEYEDAIGEQLCVWLGMYDRQCVCEGRVRCCSENGQLGDRTHSCGIQQSRSRNTNNSGRNRMHLISPPLRPMTIGATCMTHFV